MTRHTGASGADETEELRILVAEASEAALRRDAALRRPREGRPRSSLLPRTVVAALILAWIALVLSATSNESRALAPEEQAVDLAVACGERLLFFRRAYAAVASSRDGDRRTELLHFLTPRVSAAEATLFTDKYTRLLHCVTQEVSAEATPRDELYALIDRVIAVLGDVNWELEAQSARGAALLAVLGNTLRANPAAKAYLKTLPGARGTRRGDRALPAPRRAAPHAPLRSSPSAPDLRRALARRFRRRG